MKTVSAFITAALLFAATGIASAADDRHKHHSAPKPNTANALIEEMRTLDAAFREIVSAAALGDGHRVHQAIETLHGTMEKTQEALHHGKVKLRKNASKVKEFERMDHEFHADLEALAKAAHSSDMQRMGSITKKLLDGCISCHNVFRP
ncbi:MAG: cytochrome c [Candidatus Methylomirabilis sp.]|nr:cytochrome c [Deltaproteobacteria bacterium]